MKNGLGRALLIAGVALLVALAVWWIFAPPSLRVRVGDVAPDFALPHFNQPDRKGTLSELRGEPVVLVRFDSRWGNSGPYLAELERIHRRFLRDGLVVVGVALDPASEQRALEFVLHNRQVTFTVLLDPDGRVTGPLYGRPSDQADTYVIDATGRVRAAHPTPIRWTTPAEMSGLGALLPTPTPTPKGTPAPSATPSSAGSLDRPTSGG
jgi:peroxiredoxin